MFNVIFRTVFFYFFVILCYRVMGKREVGQLGITDLIVSILIAELIAISIENNKESIFLTIIPIGLLVALEVLISYISIKSRKIRIFFDGKPSLIITKGKINYREMIKQRYSLDDLLLSLRQNNIKDIEDVEYALLESNGTLSVFKYNKLKTSSTYPLPIILDGELQESSLNHINKDINWLDNILIEEELKIDDIFYAFYNKNKLYIIKRNEIK